MWLDNLKELKKAKGMSSKQIAEKTNLPERTVVRIFSGDTPNPYVDTLYRIVAILGGSLDDVLADSKTVVGSQTLVALQCEADKLSAENGLLAAENVMLKDKVGVLSAEIDLLKTKLEHKEEIIAIHNYYKTLIDGMTKT
jgi:transcriptional regulator with XRE-family HTH domain